MGAKPLFQLGHFFAEMDRLSGEGDNIDNISFNWATSSQKWIEDSNEQSICNSYRVSIGPLLRRNG